MKYVVALVLLASTAHAEVKVGDKFVELDAKTAKGKKFRLKDMGGKWVLYTFGASWCEPCKKELPAWDNYVRRVVGRYKNDVQAWQHQVRDPCQHRSRPVVVADAEADPGGEEVRLGRWRKAAEHGLGR